jgi:hypothetical protein
MNPSWGGGGPPRCGKFRIIGVQSNSRRVDRGRGTGGVFTYCTPYGVLVQYGTRCKIIVQTAVGLDDRYRSTEYLKYFKGNISRGDDGVQTSGTAFCRTSGADFLAGVVFLRRCRATRVTKTSKLRAGAFVLSPA